MLYRLNSSQSTLRYNRYSVETDWDLIFNYRELPLFRESVDLGLTDFAEEDVQSLISSIGHEFRGDKYHLINKNCNHFTSHLAKVASFLFFFYIMADKEKIIFVFDVINSLCSLDIKYTIIIMYEIYDKNAIWQKPPPLHLAARTYFFFIFKFLVYFRISLDVMRNLCNVSWDFGILFYCRTSLLDI